MNARSHDKNPIDPMDVAFSAYMGQFHRSRARNCTDACKDACAVDTPPAEDVIHCIINRLSCHSAHRPTRRRTVAKRISALLQGSLECGTLALTKIWHGPSKPLSVLVCCNIEYSGFSLYLFLCTAQWRIHSHGFYNFSKRLGPKRARPDDLNVLQQHIKLLLTCPRTY